MIKECWVTKSPTPEYPKSHPPFRIDYDEYVMVNQSESMSGAYPEASRLMESKLLDYVGSIIIPFRGNNPCCGFVFHDSRKDATDYIKMHHTLFKNLKEKCPEWFI